MAQPKWQIEYLNSIKSFSNEDLLDEYTNLAGGDGNDGMFTNRGEWEFKKLGNELRRRLIEVGFLKEERGEI